MMRVLNLEESVGKPLAHDITEIRAGEFKGPAFKHGYIVRLEDLDHLRRLGKEHLCVLEAESHQLHEDEAVLELANALCGEGVYRDEEPHEGRIDIYAARDGLLKIDAERLTRFNELGEVMCATRHSNTIVAKDDVIAGTRAIPLVIERSIVQEAVHIAGDGQRLLQVLPFRRAKAGIIITGNEVYSGLIKDQFAPILRRKVEAFHGTVMNTVILPDDDERIAAAALDSIAKGADVLLITGGMSVDPDDRSRFGLAKAGARDMVYGSSVLPGAMFMTAKLDDVPVLGIPACGVFSRITAFDVIYPRILAGDRITRRDIALLGHGGLCLQCKTCHFPLCPLGKGS